MEEKYLKLLDAETRKFIYDSEKFYPADAATASVEQQRKFYDDLCTNFDKEYPSGVKSADRWLNARETSFLVRDYSPAIEDPIAHILFFHGGGFVVGGLESHNSICADLCHETGFSLTAVDYRLAPEYIHPAAHEDCHTAFLRVSAETNLPIVLVGDSAGGNLAASVSHVTRHDKHRPVGQVLIYPALGGNRSFGSYQDHANAPMLTVSDMEFYEEIRSGGANLTDDVSANPLNDHDHSDLPPTVIITAECDPLADDGKHYCEKVAAAGGRAAWINEKGLVHGYLRARTSVSRAADSFSRIVNAISQLGRSQWGFN